MSIPLPVKSGGFDFGRYKTLVTWAGRLFIWSIIALLLIVLGTMVYTMLFRPDRTPHTETLYSGVTYTRSILSEPRDLIIHIVEIDRTDPDLRFLVTPGDPESGQDYFARKTTTFMEENGLQLAINGDFFDPFYALTPLNYYPREGDPVDALAYAISDGELVSSAEHTKPVFCVLPDRVHFDPEICPEGTLQGMGGNPLFLIDGQYEDDLIQKRHYFRDPEPRAVIAADASGDTVWFVLIDGRQDGYSEGIGLQELTPILQEMGAAYALNLDGGGSVTLAIEDPQSGRTRILNAPIHTRIPLRERPIANHIGVYAGSAESGE